MTIQSFLVLKLHSRAVTAGPPAQLLSFVQSGLFCPEAFWTVSTLSPSIVNPYLPRRVRGQMILTWLLCSTPVVSS